MKKLFVFALFILIASLTSNATLVSDNNDVEGEWKFEVTNAPYGYQKGVIRIVENENELSGEVKFADGYKIKLKEVVCEGNSLKIGLYVDYEYVSVKATVNNDEIKGTVVTSGGDMNFTAEKVK